MIQVANPSPISSLSFRSVGLQLDWRSYQKYGTGFSARPSLVFYVSCSIHALFRLAPILFRVLGFLFTTSDVSSCLNYHLGETNTIFLDLCAHLPLPTIVERPSSITSLEIRSYDQLLVHHTFTVGLGLQCFRPRLGYPSQRLLSFDKRRIIRLLKRIMIAQSKYKPFLLDSACLYLIRRGTT